MKKYLDVLLKAILAGVAIGIGGTVYLSIDNKVAGSALFAIGLFIIFSCSFNLFTGKIGYLVTSKPIFIVDLVFIWLGNLIGTYFVGAVERLTRAGEKLSTAAAGLCETKFNDDLLSILILAFFCGVLMFLAADNYKNGKSSIQQHLAIFLPVMVFILSGFEHCVANMYYFSVAGVWSLKALGYMGIMTLGNAMGGWFIPFVRVLCSKCVPVENK